ncbi:ADP-ribosylglycohydrolase [compost metagenome]
MIEQSDRIKGSLFGLLWGDVLGCPVETWKDFQIKNVYGKYSDLPTSFPFDKMEKVDEKFLKRARPLGLYSDDGQQALALLNICCNDKGWKKESWSSMLKDGAESEIWRGTGRFFNDAVRRLSTGVREEKSGSQSSGIGSAMRVGPLGAYFRDDIEALEKAIFESSAITHADIAAIAFSFAIADAVHMFVNGYTIDEVKANLGSHVMAFENQIFHGYADWNINRSKDNLVSNTINSLLIDYDFELKDLNKVREKISELAKPHLAEGFVKAHPNQGFVLTGGMHALVMALQNQLNPQEALISIVNMGYDTDTVAAIAGSILGARYGYDWIPKERILDIKRVEKYANAMVDFSAKVENKEKFIENEKTLTLREKRFQKSNKN